MFPFHTVQSINEDTSSLTQIEQMCKCVLFVKTRRFYSFTVNSQLKLKKNTILETFIREILIRNLTRFHGALFEIKTLETFATAFFLLKSIIWTFLQVLQSVLLQNENKISKICKPRQNSLTW